MADQDVAEIKYALSDPTRVLEALGIMGEGRARLKQPRGWTIRCPWHQENSPSCSVRVGPDGTIQVKCHGCDHGDDVLGLVAVARGLNIKSNFRDVLVEGARLGGLWHLVDKLEGREPREPRPAFVSPPVITEPPREWPPQAEVDTLWALCTATTDDTDVATYLRTRSLDPDVVDGRGLARALPAQGTLPRWAVCKGGSWREVGYKLVIPMYDANGEMRSVRVGRVVDGDGPKRRPPFGHKASELVMADAFGVAMLRGEIKPYRVVIVEGEPDFFSRASVMNDAHGCALGIVSGSWTKAFAERIPFGARVFLRTDVDQAGDRYAQEIEATLRRRAFLWRREA